MKSKRCPVKDGEWFEVSTNPWKLGCCDCGLTHIMFYRMRRGKLQIQAFRDNRATANKRRAKKCSKPSSR